MTAPDFIPGNTRLRARLADLVSDEQTAALVGCTLPELTEALRSVGVATGTASRGTPRPGEASRAELLAAVDLRRDGLLRAAAAAYQGEARDLVQALFDEDDRADLIALVRAAAAGAPAGLALSSVRAVGRFDEATVRDLVGGEPEAIVARLVAGRLPDPDTAGAVARAWERFALHTDLAELEATVAYVHADATRRRVAALGAAAAPVAHHLAHRRDALNLSAAVRLRDADFPGKGFLPEGTVPLAGLRAVVAGREVAAVAPSRWRVAAAAAEPRGPEPLARALDDLVEGAARDPSWRMEPLGARVPVAYVAKVRHEARQLRRLVVLAPDDAGYTTPARTRGGAAA